jgi:oligopeptide/dipeptide ABC transporter ATP-binding protein
VRLRGGEIRLDGAGRIDDLSERRLRGVRGRRVGMVFQDPSTFLDPLMTVGRHVMESLRAHRMPGDHRARALALLADVGLPDPGLAFHNYPHELSGGQRQRVMIAAALAAEPDLLIADEPTTALDVTVQAAILDLLRSLRDSLGLAILFITHDLGVVAELCDRVYVMYAGSVVEQRSVNALFTDPRHPYSAGLLKGQLSPFERTPSIFTIPGEVLPPARRGLGCRFLDRCPLAEARCEQAPALEPVFDGEAACWRSHDPELATAWGVQDAE